MLIEQIFEFELRKAGPVGGKATALLQLIMLVTKQIPRRKSGLLLFRKGLLFTVKILHETIYLSFPFLGQITYKI